MSTPKADDNGKILGKCNNPTDPHLTYVPSNSDIPITYPVDRAGNPIYGYVNMSGNHDTGCRMTPLHGHPQDYSRTLYNNDVNQIPFYWEERGVELYENFGLSEDIFPYNGNYGIIGPDTQNYDSPDSGANTGTKCNSGTQVNANKDGKSQGCQNRCITELGRKISLFGQVGFAFYDRSSALPKNFVVPQYPPDMYTNIGYIINFYKETRVVSGDLYDYFGNSGVCIKDANGVQYYFIYGKQPYMISAQGSKSIVPSQTVDDWVVVDGPNMYIDIKFFNVNASSPVGLNCSKNGVVVQASKSVSSNCTSDSNMDSLDFPAVAAPFPGNWYSQLYCDTGRSFAGETRFSNCNYSGIRSMYIPPHMRVDSFSTLEIVDGYVAPWTSASGTVKYNMVDYDQANGMINPFTYDMSPYSNGVFPSLAGSTPNSPLDDNSNNNYNSVSYLSPAIHNCSLMGIWVNVRRDMDFRNRYVTNWYTNARLMPEILLIPGITYSSTFLNVMLQIQPNPNELQKISDPQKFWTDDNPYWDESVVVLNTAKQPYDVLPITTAAQVLSMAVTIPNKIVKSIPKNPITHVGYPMIKSILGDMVKKRNISFTSISPRPQGTGRIKSFDVCNGVFSLEWTYVIYGCAYSYLQNQSNNLTYNPSTKQYGCSGDCNRECMLFRDPYYITSTSDVSASDMFMKLYCFAKNVTIAYAIYSDPATNDCSCTASLAYCPGVFDDSCNPTRSTGYNSYIPDGTNQVTSTCSNVCSYCSAVNVQLNFADGNATSTQNAGIKSVGQCSGASQCDIVSDGSSTTVSSGTATDTSSKISFLVIIIIVLILLSIIGYVAYRKFMHTKNN
jgi:hypothetical protein